jgi:hypothetical protein
MTRQHTQIRHALIQQFNAASDYIGGCTQHQREVAHYEHGRKAGLAQALELVDALVRSEEGRPVRRRRAEEIVAAVESEQRHREPARIPLH